MEMSSLELPPGKKEMAANPLRILRDRQTSIGTSGIDAGGNVDKSGRDPHPTLPTGVVPEEAASAGDDSKEKKADPRTKRKSCMAIDLYSFCWNVKRAVPHLYSH